MVFQDQPQHRVKNRYKRIKMPAIHRTQSLPVNISDSCLQNIQSADTFTIRSGASRFLYSPAPKCSSYTFDQSVHEGSLSVSSYGSVCIPMLLRTPDRIKRQRTSTPSPSRNSSQFMDLEFWSNLETPSPAPSWSSVFSNQSVERSIDSRTRPGMIPSPCVSCTSDQSMGQPILFKNTRYSLYKRPNLETPSPAPSCSSVFSNQSVEGSIDSRTRPGMIPSPCVSYRSDQSMGQPILFNDTKPSLYKREPFTSLLIENCLKCSHCNDVLKEPVTIPCGHSFCKACIQSYWEKYIYDEHCSCPQCRKRFTAFPDLKLNTALDDSLKKAGFSPALPSQSYAGPGDVACDICSGNKLRAVKWCLTCSVSYCEKHVRDHYTVEALNRHIFTDIPMDLKMITYQQHQRALEGMMEELKDHDTVLVKGGGYSAKAKATSLLQQIKLKVEITHLRKHNQELAAKNKNLERVESELSHLTKRFCRGLQEPTDTLDFTSELVEVAALGRQLDLGMLYDCRTESFRCDMTFWEKDLLSSMKLSIPRPQTDVKILEKDTLQDRLAALDLSISQRASVVSGLVDLSGASAFINHPVQSEQQERVTLCYRSSTRLDMLSHEVLHRPPVSVTGSTTATHVVAAVLYGSQAFFVFDRYKERSDENTNLRDTVKNLVVSSSQTDFLSRLIEKQTAPSPLYDTASFIDGDIPADSTLPNVRAVPLKVWLYPLKNLDQTSACVAKDISEDQLSNAENILEALKMETSVCQHLMSVDGGHDVFSMFPALKEIIAEFSSSLQKYRSNFQRNLACCVKTIRETGAEKAQENLRDLMDTNHQCTQYIHQWLQNKSDQIRALIRCRSENIIIRNSENGLQHFVKDSRADRVLCFVFTSLDRDDPFLSTLRQNAETVNTGMTTETQQTFRTINTNQSFLSDLDMFILNKKTSVQDIMFIAAPVLKSHFPVSAVRLYQSGILISQNVNLDIKPDPPEIITAQETRVTVKLQRLKTQTDLQNYRVEYRAVKDDSHADMKWRVVCYTGEICVVSKLAPGTLYQLQYALKDSNSMSDYSTVTEFQTSSRARPGAPTVLKPNKESVYIAWQKPETDEDSAVQYYIVEYLEVGLEGWQTIQTDGPVCECTITLPYSTCYRARVSAVYGDGDISTPSEETQVPDRVWYIDLSKRRAPIFLELLRRKTTKKSVKLRDCTDEESEVRCFLQCLSYISQLRIYPPQIPRESPHAWRDKITSFLLNLCLQAAIHHKETIVETVQKVSLCYFKTSQEQSAFLLDLYSHVKDYETQTGENIQPALQAVYQTLPEVWSINLSEKKASLFLEVLKLQSVKKAIELRGWSEEECEMRSLLHCLPYISQLRFIPLQPRGNSQERRTKVRRYLLDLCLQAALYHKKTIQTILEKCFKTDKETSDFLLLLHSHVRDYETRTGGSVLPALQEVYRSLPKIWSINLSEKKASLFLEVLKVQSVKKAVELRGWSEEECEMRSLLHCLPYISQLRFGFALHGKRRKLTTLHFLVKLIAGAAELSTETGESYSELLASLCSFRAFSFPGDDQEFDTVTQCNILLDLYLHVKHYEDETGRSVLPVLQSIYESVPEVWIINLTDKRASVFLEVLKLQTVKKAVELRGWSNEKRKVRSFFQCLPHISQLRLCTDALVRMAQAKSLRSRAPVTLDELLLTNSSAQQPDGMPCRILEHLGFLLNHWKIKCLNLTEYKTTVQSLLGLLNHQGLQSVRFSDETLQKLVGAVYETRDENVARRFLQNVGGDLTSCSLGWDVIQWFLQHHKVTVDFRRITNRKEDIQDVLPVLNKLQIRGLKSSFVLSVMRKLYEMSSTHSLSGLLSSTNNCLNLENRTLTSLDCAALRFTLEHCISVSLNLLWTSIPEEDLESIVPLLSHVSHLRVDRLLMLRLLHCCSVPELHQEAAVLLSSLQHKLDFSSRDALDLTADTITKQFLSGEDCRVIAMAIQRAHTQVQLNVQDCEIEDSGVEELFPVLHTVTLDCRKDLLLQFLSLVHVGPESGSVRRAMALSQALRNNVDLSETHLNPQACKSLALVLEYSDGVSELDLSHCQLTDHELELLMPHLHKACVLDLSNNQITDVSARNIYNMVSANSSIQSVSLFNNRMSDSSLFLLDQRFEIWCG